MATMTARRREKCGDSSATAWVRRTFEKMPPAWRATSLLPGAGDRAPRHTAAQSVLAAASDGSPRGWPRRGGPTVPRAHRRRARGTRLGPAVRILRLRDRQSRLCRFVSRVRRRFNDAVDDYCGLLGLAARARRKRHRRHERLSGRPRSRTAASWPSEAEIVDAKRRNRISEVFLIDRPVVRRRSAASGGAAPTERVRWLEDRSSRCRLIRGFARSHRGGGSDHLRAGHAALEPVSVLPDEDLSRAIASNLTAMKLLVTNIQADAEIPGNTAVDIVERAVYYLKEKGRLPLPVPSLITHYIINDPRVGEPDQVAGVRAARPARDARDPRLVRIGHYEDGVTGRHDASKVLTPFLEYLPLSAAATAHGRVALRRRFAEQAQPVGAGDASRRDSRSRRSTSRCSTLPRPIWTKCSCSPLPIAAAQSAASRRAPGRRSGMRLPNGSSTTPSCSSRPACTAAKTSWASSPRC